MRSISFTLGSSLLCTTVDLASSSFLFLLLRPSRWRLNALARFILPDPVTLNRFLAPEFVFCFGITLFKNLDGKYRDTFYKTKPAIKQKPPQRMALYFRLLTAYFFLLFGASVINIRLPSKVGSCSTVATSFSLSANCSRRSSPLSLNTMARPRNIT